MPRYYNIICKNCGKQSRTQNKIFCNHKCHREFTLKTKPKCVCDTCKKEFTPKQESKANRYCSKKCFHADKDFMRKNMLSNETLKKYQKEVGSWMTGKKNMGFGYKCGKDNLNWHNGSSFLPYTTDFNQQLKDRIRVRDNFKCQLCKTPELEFNRKLDIHHIDYDKKNSKEDNLISLCNKCHIKTNHNREYWINYFSNLQEVI